MGGMPARHRLPRDVADREAAARNAEKTEHRRDAPEPGRTERRRQSGAENREREPPEAGKRVGRELRDGEEVDRAESEKEGLDAFEPGEHGGLRGWMS